MSAYSNGSNKPTQRLADVGNFWQDPDANFNFYGNAMSILSRVQGVEILALEQLIIDNRQRIIGS